MFVTDFSAVFTVLHKFMVYTPQCIGPTYTALTIKQHLEKFQGFLQLNEHTFNFLCSFLSKSIKFIPFHQKSWNPNEVGCLRSIPKSKYILLQKSYTVQQLSQEFSFRFNKIAKEIDIEHILECEDDCLVFLYWFN